MTILVGTAVAVMAVRRKRMAIECSYYLEPVDTTDLPHRFLDAFAAVLSHSNYAMVLDAAPVATSWLSWPNGAARPPNADH